MSEKAITLLVAAVITFLLMMSCLVCSLWVYMCVLIQASRHA